MMEPIVKEKPIFFKELEQKIFRYVCGLGCEITRMVLESPTGSRPMWWAAPVVRTSVPVGYGTPWGERISGEEEHAVK